VIYIWCCYSSHRVINRYVQSPESLAAPTDRAPHAQPRARTHTPTRPRAQPRRKTRPASLLESWACKKRHTLCHECSSARVHASITKHANGKRQDRTFAAGSLTLYCSSGGGVMIISYWFMAAVLLSRQSITMLLFTELYYFPSFWALSYDNISIFFVNPLWYFLHISFQLLFSFAICDQRILI
jgi:hypothetical protein